MKSLIFLLSSILYLSALPSLAASHGLALYGELKYKPNFSHFDYVNPAAPKAGTLKQYALGSFDSFNPFILKGTPAQGINFIYDSLLKQSADEPFSLYGLIAEKVEVAADRSWIKFYLNPHARFSDGESINADDVVYSLRLLREQGNPFYRIYYKDISKAEALNTKTVKFSFNAQNKELPMIIASLPILPKHYWQNRKFSEVNLNIPVSSGPYQIENFDAGRQYKLKLNPNYWAKDLNVNKGQYNFKQIVYDYYRDETVALEAFKAGEYDLRLETSAKRWTYGYQGPALEQQKIKLKQQQHQNTAPMQAFVFNSRRVLFNDKKVRQALSYAFDFEWSNKALFHNAYQRTQSYFDNSELAAKGLPTKAELAILKPLEQLLPQEVFTQTYKTPSTAGTGNIRSHLRQAKRLLAEAGWVIKKGVLRDTKTGQPFKFEIILVSQDFQRVVAPFIQNLKLLGIDAKVRLLDLSQYITRLRQFDFDLVVANFPSSNSPGNEQYNFWHSNSANQLGSNNLAGIRNPAIDRLIEQLVAAPTREKLVMHTRALDRALLWNHYVIPQWYLNSYRIAHWHKLDYPKQAPSHSMGLENWWMKVESP